MRTSTILVFLLGVSFAICQATTEESHAEHVIRIMMSRASEGLYTSWDEKELNKLGDASAEALTKVLGKKNLSSAEINQVVLILRLSFDAPGAIEVESDRRPKAALALLKQLNSLKVSPEASKRIRETREFVEHVGKVNAP